MKLPQSKMQSGVEGSAEETLKILANLPAPVGLVERVQDSLCTAPPAARVFFWRAPLVPAGGWMHATVLRGVAAAAIVCVVAGGGWRIYSHVQTIPGSALNQLAPQTTPTHGFSSADAKRVPNTITGPVLTHAIVPGPAEQAPAQAKLPAHAKGKSPRKPAAPPPAVPVP